MQVFFIVNKQIFSILILHFFTLFIISSSFFVVSFDK
jgi:hypothetical protein